MRLFPLTAALALSAAGLPAAAAPQGVNAPLVMPRDRVDRVPSGAGEIRLAQIPGESRERTLVEGIVPEAAGQPVETAVYDLDEDGKPELVARLLGPKSCEGQPARCRTVVLRSGRNGWEKVLDRKSAKVEAGKMGFGGMRAVVLDGRETFNWDGDGYRMDVAAAGAPVVFQDAPASFRGPLLSQFGPGAVKLAARSPRVAVKVASASVRDGSQVVVARLEGPGACGAVLGCPFRVLQVKSGAYVTLSEGLGDAKMAVLPVMRTGYRDIMVGSPRGWSVYGWSGKSYVLVPGEGGLEGRK